MRLMPLLNIRAVRSFHETTAADMLRCSPCIRRQWCSSQSAPSASAASAATGRRRTGCPRRTARDEMQKRQHMQAWGLIPSSTHTLSHQFKHTAEAQAQLTGLAVGATQTGTPALLARSLQVVSLLPVRTRGSATIDWMFVEAPGLPGPCMHAAAARTRHARRRSERTSPHRRC